MILFCLRRFNDIDHTVPVIYRFAKDGRSDFLVALIDEALDKNNDPRLRYLSEEWGIEAHYIQELCTPSLLHRLAAAGYRYAGLHQSGPITFLLRGIIRRVLERLEGRLYDKEWMGALIQERRISSIVLDWQHLDRRRFPSLMMEIAERHKVPIVAVPHGIGMYAHSRWTSGEWNFGIRARGFNHFLVQHREYKDFVVAEGYPSSRVHVLGSTRFCAEWRPILERIHSQGRPRAKAQSIQANQRRRLRIVYMDHVAAYRIQTEMAAKSLLRLRETGLVDIAIKPTTSLQGRGRSAAPLAQLSTPLLAQAGQVRSETASLDLVHWADVVMGTTSSILLEALLTNRAFIYPKHFHDNEMLWEPQHFNCCWQVLSDEEMEQAVRTLWERPDFRPYSSRNVERFIRHIVYGGIRERDVLGDYMRLIEAIASGLIPDGDLGSNHTNRADVEG